MKSIITLMLAFGLVSATFAQEGNKQLLQRLQLSTAQREQLKKEQEQALEKVLTTEQKKKLKEIRRQQQERKEEMQGRQRQQLKDRLSLTDEQATRLQELQKNFMESMKKNRQQLDQTIAQQRERAREMMETHQQSLKKLLSAEQLDTYKTMMRDKMREGMQRLKGRAGDVEQRPPAGSRPSLDRRPPPPNGTTGEPRPDTL